MTTSFNLKGKVAIVTGGNGGIGLGMATRACGCGRRRRHRRARRCEIANGRG